MMRTIFGLVIGGVLFGAGAGFIAGWKYNAVKSTVTIDGGEQRPVAMHPQRADLRSLSGTIRDGFIRLLDWALGLALEAVEFLESVFRGARFEARTGGEEATVLEWNESTQKDRDWWRGYNDDLRAGTYTTKEFLYIEVPDVAACYAGELAGGAKDRALEAANQIRALHSLSAVQYSRRYDQQVQAASLIQAAAGYPGHFPEPPAPCYTDAGAEGSRTSNLYGSSNGLRLNGDPAADMIGWTNDAKNRSRVAAVGHRRWVLNPFAVHFAYGQVEGHAAQKVFGFAEEPALTPRIAVDFVAFPFEVYPFNLVGEGSPWSVSVIEDKKNLQNNQHDYFRQATITVIRTADETTLAITDRYTDTRGVGLPNVLSWRVAGWEYDTLYQVEINNVRMRSGSTQSYSYPVLIDRANIEY